MYVYLWLYVHTYLHTSLYACMYVWMWRYIHVCMHFRVHADKYVITFGWSSILRSVLLRSLSPSVRRRGNAVHPVLHVTHISLIHYNDVTMSAMASQIASLRIVYSTVYSGTDWRKHQSSASLAFVTGIHRWPHKRPVMREMFPFHDAIM